MYQVYILVSNNNPKTYTGITDNIERRLKQHNNGYHAYTKRYKPWTLIHLENYENRIEARKREKYLKTAVGRRWIKNSYLKIE